MSKRKRKTNAADPPQEETPDRAAEVEEVELSEEGLQLVGQLQAERDEAIAARQRALADFANYQRRAQENEARALRDGVGSVVRSLLPALDHFDLALGQDVGQITVQQLYDGVRIVREELGKALERQGVRVIAPKIGDEFDPNEHKAVLRQPTGEQAPNTIVSILQVGYAIDSLVLRPASVAVAATPDDDDEQE
jgi:molecular chaperone GrpE